MRILLAIDGSPSASAAISEFCRRPWPLSSQVRVVIVERPADVSRLTERFSTAFDEIVREQRDQALRIVEEATQRIQGLAPAVEVTSLRLEGYPKEALVDEAERWGADLIMLGSTGYGAVKRFLLGSVSLAVAINAPCSVEIVRPRPEAQAPC